MKSLIQQKLLFCSFWEIQNLLVSKQQILLIVEKTVGLEARVSYKVYLTEGAYHRNQGNQFSAVRRTFRGHSCQSTLAGPISASSAQMSVLSPDEFHLAVQYE